MTQRGTSVSCHSAVAPSQPRRSRPEPEASGGEGPSASMATASHDASTQHSHYQAFPGSAFPSHSDNHLYASFASPWPSPHDLPQPSGPSSAMFQFHRPSVAASRPLPADCYPYAGPVDYAHQHPEQASWPSADHYRSDTLPDNAFSLRSPVQYPDAEPGASVPQPNPQSADHHIQYAPLADFRPPAQQQECRLAPDFSASQTPPYHHPSTERSAPVARLLNYPLQPTAALHVQTQPVTAQSSMSWPAGPSSAVAPPARQDYPTNTSNMAFSPGLAMVVSPATSSGSSWSHVSGGANPSVAPAFEVDSDWTLVDQPAEHLAHPHPVPQLNQPPPPPPAEPSHHSSPSAASVIRTGRKASASFFSKKLATVPSPYIKRQDKNKVSRRNGPLAIERRENAHKMRKVKRICLRCRFYKAGCDEGDPCARCMKTSASARIFLVPCCRDHIEDTSLVRRCNGRFNQSEADFLRYPWKNGGNLHVMEIIWNLPGFGPISTNQPLQIKFREYHPEATPIESTEWQWQNTEGLFVKVETPPYAVHDTAALQEDVEAYFLYTLPSVEHWIFGRNRHDEIAWLTYSEAVRIRGRSGSGSELLQLALQLQYLSVVSQGYGSVWTNDIPGIKQYDFKAMGHSAYEAYDRNKSDRPLPVAINHQMDVAFVKFLRRLEEKTFKVLAKKIFKTGLKPWYELFLALFVLLWNLEYIHSGAEHYIKAKRGTHVASQMNVVSRQIQKWDFSFGVLMMHWKASLRGFEPFKVARENPEELRTKGNLPDAQSFDYMTRMVAILDRTGPIRHPPPLTGFAGTPSSLGSKWIASLIKEAGG